jgi:hypothetical protein
MLSMKKHCFSSKIQKFFLNFCIGKKKNYFWLKFYQIFNKLIFQKNTIFNIIIYLPGHKKYGFWTFTEIKHLVIKWTPEKIGLCKVDFPSTLHCGQPTLLSYGHQFKTCLWFIFSMQVCSHLSFDVATFQIYSLFHTLGGIETVGNSEPWKHPCNVIYISKI